MTKVQKTETKNINRQCYSQSRTCGTGQDGEFYGLCSAWAFAVVDSDVLRNARQILASTVSNNCKDDRADLLEIAIYLSDAYGVLSNYNKE